MGENDDPRLKKDQESREKSSRARWVFIYTSLFSLSGASILVYSALNLPGDWIGLAVFATLAVVSESLSVELFSATRESRVSVSGIISIAGLLIYGPAAGAIMGSVVGLTTILIGYFAAGAKPSKERASWFQRVLFNIGMLAVSMILTGYIYVFAGGKIGHPMDLNNILPLVFAVTANESINILILMGVLTIQTGSPVSKIWKQNFAWGMPIGIIGGVIGGGALAIAFEMFYIFGLLVFLLPVLLTGYSLRLYINHTRQYVVDLEAVNRSLDEANLGLLETLGAVIDAYDVYTYGHSAQIAIYVDAIAQKLRLPKLERAKIVKAGLVHDIGKVGITDAIIGKPGPLTEDEYHLVQRHPIIGADILRRNEGLQDLVPLVRHHHERWDGGGYPAGLAGEEIPLGARIIGLADAVDAMVSARPYRPRQPLESVKEEVRRCAGTQFDPRVAAAFLTLLDEKGSELFIDSAERTEQTLFQNGIDAIGVGVRYLKKSMLVE